jgi:fluoride ion exporter CrcB/FEX
MGRSSGFASAARPAQGRATSPSGWGLQRLGPTFPNGTFVVNLIGSFLMGAPDQVPPGRVRPVRPMNILATVVTRFLAGIAGIGYARLAIGG